MTPEVARGTLPLTIRDCSGLPQSCWRGGAGPQEARLKAGNSARLASKERLGQKSLGGGRV